MSQVLRNLNSAQAKTGQGAQSQTAVAQKAADPVTKFINNLAPQLAAALPRHITPDYMTRVVLTEMRMNPKLMECEPKSLAGALMVSAQLGLVPGGPLGHAYLLPFEKRKKEGNQWITERIDCQLIVGYRGMIDLARRSGQIVSIEARAVYQGDNFRVRLGLDPHLEHEPSWGEDDPDALRFVYSVAKLKDGGVQFEVMSRAQIETVRKQSKASNNGPWVTHFAEMAKKTVIRRLFKMLPVSIELATAINLDEKAEMGVDQGLVIDAGTGEILTPPPSDAPHGSASVDIPGEDPRGSASPSLLNTYIAQMEGATSSAALDELYVRAEGDLSASELEQLLRAYRAKKAKLNSSQFNDDLPI